MIIPFGRRWNRRPGIGGIDIDDSAIESFKESVYVAKFFTVCELLANRSSPSAAYERDRDKLYDIIVRRIVQRKIVLSYSPQDPTKFSLPGATDEQRNEALFYWCARLGESMAHILEAHARNGNGVAVERIGQTIKKIAFEDSANQTDSFFSQNAFKDTDPTPN